MYSLKTTVYGNPDRGQDPRFPPYGVTQTTLQSDTLSGLQERVSQWQSENAIGAGNWVPATVSKNGKTVGFMSFNGRVWKEKNLTEEVL